MQTFINTLSVAAVVIITVGFIYASGYNDYVFKQPPWYEVIARGIFKLILLVVAIVSLCFVFYLVVNGLVLILSGEPLDMGMTNA